MFNGYLFSSLRKLDFQASELTRSASKQRRDLAAIANQLDQALIAAARASDGIPEDQLNSLISNMAKAEFDNARPDCGPLSARNGQRLRLLQARFRSFATNFDTLSRKASASELANPNKIQELAAQIKADVMRECKR